MTYQQTIVVGNLGQDPEMRYLPSGDAVTNFSLATNKSRIDKDTGERIDTPTWFRISVWGKAAESANEYLSKGRTVLVQGELRPDPQTGGPKVFTRQDGTAGASYELTAYTWRFVGPKMDEYGAAEGRAAGAEVGVPASEEDEIPF